jgi:hypothetical protein
MKTKMNLHVPCSVARKRNIGAVLLLVLQVATLAHAQLTPSDDAYVNSAAPTTNYGTAITLNLQSAADTAFIRFDLTAVPAGTPGSSIAKATLKLYVNSVTTAGSFNVDYVTGTWAEQTIKYNLQPAIGTTIAASVPLTTASKGKYVEIDVTAAMVEWLNGTQANDGIALVANSPLVATFDSKENTTSSHAPELDLVFASGGITGVTTASGSGLMGGGTSGTLNLSLTNACAANQVLQWNGTAWVCANLKGSGTITGVKAGTDLTGGGTTGNVTVNLDTTKVPQLSANNTFTGNQSLTGNLSATGSITGQTASFSANNSTQVVSVTQSGTGSGIVATMPTPATSYIPAILGNATNTAGYGIGVQGISAAGGGFGVFGMDTNSANSTNGYGVHGETRTSYGAGVSGSAGSILSGASAVGVLGISSTSNGIGVDGYESSSTSGIGVRGITNGSSGVGVLGRWLAGSAFEGAGVGVWGDSSTGLGVLGTTDNSQGVAGWATNNGTAVYANSYNGNGLFATSTNNWAVVGNSPFSGGVYGISQSIAGTYGAYAYGSQSGAGFTTVGVWGDTGFGNGFGVVGTADNGNSFFGKNNTVNHETLYVENDSGFSGGFTPYAARFAGPGSSTYCYIARDGHDNGTGDLVCTGSKSAAVPVDGNRMVRLYAVEAADNWFEDAGSGQLSNGSASVALDNVFAQTVNGDVEYHVFITPNGECEGLYVTHKGALGFEVHELHGGHSNIPFDYRIMARRKGFENVRMQDVTADFAHVKQQSDLLAARFEARKQEEKAHPKMEAPAPPQRSPLSSPPSPRTPVLPVEPARLVGSIK